VGGAADEAKLMLWNPGELRTNWTVAKLKCKHRSRPFNPDVANAFFRAGMIETWGRGIERTLEACRAANSPRPASAADALCSVEALVMGAVR
jgi:ATP-dependent DNA helicase RecG